MPTKHDMDASNARQPHVCLNAFRCTRSSCVCFVDFPHPGTRKAMHARARQTGTIWRPKRWFSLERWSCVFRLFYSAWKPKAGQLCFRLWRIRMAGIRTQFFSNSVAVLCVCRIRYNARCRSGGSVSSFWLRVSIARIHCGVRHVEFIIYNYLVAEAYSLTQQTQQQMRMSLLDRVCVDSSQWRSGAGFTICCSPSEGKCLRIIFRTRDKLKGLFRAC